MKPLHIWLPFRFPGDFPKDQPFPDELCDVRQENHRILFKLVYQSCLIFVAGLVACVPEMVFLNV